jgi:predicted nucleic acid-binding protein
MKVVDTTLLIGHARGEERVASYLAAHEGETLVVPTVVFQELAVGEVLARDESKAAICNHLGAFDVRAFDADHAYHAAVIEAKLRSTGEYDPALAADILVGGVARSLSVPAVTRNTTHFERFDDVIVESY